MKLNFLVKCPPTSENVTKTFQKHSFGRVFRYQFRAGFDLGGRDGGKNPVCWFGHNFS